MRCFKYKARDINGKLVEGILDAENESNLADKLSELDFVLIGSRAVKSTEMRSFYFGKVKRREIILFTNHLATSVEAGVSVVQAISDYAKETESVRIKKIVEDVDRQVMAGVNLSEAMSKHPKAFSELYVSIVATGEATGKLELVLRDLVTFLEWQEELAGQIRQASIYPSFLISLMIGVIIIMMTVMLPKFIPILESFDVELPTPTKILIGVSEFFTKKWIYLILGILLFVIIYKITYMKQRGRYFWDSVKLKLPLLGKLHHKIVLSKFAHYFSMLYCSGIGIIESFNIIQRLVGNEVLREAIARCRDSVEQGGSIFESLKKENTFPPLVMRMIQVGESTGQLDTSLQKVAQYYDKEVPASIRKMFAVFEPTLIIIMGGIVLIMALAVFMPIYKLTSTIGKHR